MKYKTERFEIEDDYGLDDENRDQKRYRKNKKAGGKRRRDSFEGRDRDWDWK